MERGGDCALRLRGVAIDISEQKLASEQIARMQGELRDASRLAGMAEVATGVLHNVGNVLSSVNVSAGILDEIIAPKHRYISPPSRGNRSRTFRQFEHKRRATTWTVALGD